MNINNPNGFKLRDDLVAVIKKVAQKSSRSLTGGRMEFDVMGDEHVDVYIRGDKVGGLKHKYVGQKYQFAVSSPNIRKERTKYGQRNDEALTEMPNRAAVIASEAWTPRSFESIKREISYAANNVYTQAKYKEESKIDSVLQKVVKSRTLRNAPAYGTIEYAMHDLFRDFITNSSSVDYVKDYFSKLCSVTEYIENLSVVERARGIASKVVDTGVILRFVPRINKVQLYDLTNWGSLLKPTEYNSVEELPPAMVQCYAMLNIAEEGNPLWGMGLRVDAVTYYLEDGAIRGDI